MSEYHLLHAVRMKYAPVSELAVDTHSEWPKTVRRTSLTRKVIATGPALEAVQTLP
jgi:hypothetical protein